MPTGWKKILWRPHMSHDLNNSLTIKWPHVMFELLEGWVNIKRTPCSCPRATWRSCQAGVMLLITTRDARKLNNTNGIKHFGGGCYACLDMGVAPAIKWPCMKSESLGNLIDINKMGVLPISFRGSPGFWAEWVLLSWLADHKEP